MGLNQSGRAVAGYPKTPTRAAYPRFHAPLPATPDIFNCQMECALPSGQVTVGELTGLAGYRRERSMAKHRTYSMDFKRQVALEFLGGETLHGLGKRHDVSRNLIRVWVAKYEAGEFSDEAEAADLLQEYEARIAALERLVGRQALEIEFLKGAQKSTAPARNGTTSVVVGPTACPSSEGAG